MQAFDLGAKPYAHAFSQSNRVWAFSARHYKKAFLGSSHFKYGWIKIRGISTPTYRLQLQDSIKPSQESTIIKNEDPVGKRQTPWNLPRGAWDTHFHVFEQSYPYSPSRAYTPPAAPEEYFKAFNKSLTSTGKSSALVIVQPSCYGTDNSLVLDLLKKQTIAQGQDVRAIVVVDPDRVTDEELINMHNLGVRGIRLNMEASGRKVSALGLEKSMLKVAGRLEKLEMLKGWFLQLYISGSLWEEIEGAASESAVRIIADHQGGMKGKSELPTGTDTTAQPGFQSLMRLASNGKVFVKISAGYRSSKLTQGGYDDLEELIKFFASRLPHQLLWGSDWPHTGSRKDRPSRGIEVLEPFREVDNEAALRNLWVWMGEEMWMRMMVENPKRMFY